MREHPAVIAKKAVYEVMPSRKILVQSALAFYGVKFFVPVHYEPGSVAACAMAEHHLQRAMDAAPHVVSYVRVRIVHVIARVV